MIRPGFLPQPKTASSFEASCVANRARTHGIARRQHAILLFDDGKSCRRRFGFSAIWNDDNIRVWLNLSARWLGCPCFERLKGVNSPYDAAARGACGAWLEARFCRFELS